MATLMACGALSAPALGSPATVSTSFTPSSVALEGTASLTYSISNLNTGMGSALASIGFTDSLPPGLVVATPNGLSGNCGMGETLGATPGSSTVSLSNGSLPDGPSVCAISVNVTGTWGGHRTESVTVSSSGGTSTPATATLTVAEPPPRDRLYFTNAGSPGNGTISFANLDGSGGGDLATGGATVNAPTGIALDAATGRVYWTNNGSGVNKISYANLDGSGGGDLSVTGATVSGPFLLALDPVARRIYWFNGGTNTFASANLDGSNGGPVSTSPVTVNSGHGLALDPAAGRLYWTNNNAISYADLHGGPGGNLNTAGGAPPNMPLGMALDSGAGLIYWMNLSGMWPISEAGLDGSGSFPGPLPATAPTDPTGVAIDPAAGHIYWADGVGSKIGYAGIGSGTGGNLSTPYGLNNEFLALLRAPEPARPPAVTGGSVPGSMLMCSEGAWAPDLAGSFLYRAPQSFAYQWSLNGTDIAGATSSSYTANQVGNYSCRVTAANFAGSASQTSAPATITAPPATPSLGSSPPLMAVTQDVISNLAVNPSTLVPAGSGGPVTMSRATKPGAIVSYTGTEPAVTTFTVQQPGAGRVSRRACVKPTKKNRRRAHCALSIGSFTHTDAAGANRFRFTGRVNGHKLKPGGYQLQAIPRDTAGLGPARSTSFRVRKK